MLEQVSLGAKLRWIVFFAYPIYRRAQSWTRGIRNWLSRTLPFQKPLGRVFNDPPFLSTDNQNLFPDPLVR
jgi:hypothetical protein